MTRVGNSLAIEALSLFVRNRVLTAPERYEWTIQGFGMLRTYLSPELRIHIWDSRFRTPGVHDIHDHPWHFESLVLAGAIENVVYRPTSNGKKTHSEGLIVCGVSPARKDVQIQRAVCLVPEPGRLYGPGDAYYQAADEIHRSIPLDGTVTIIRRTATSKDPDRALVYFPIGETWVSAEPKFAPTEMVKEICKLARESVWCDRKIEAPV